MIAPGSQGNRANPIALLLFYQASVAGARVRGLRLSLRSTLFRTFVLKSPLRAALFAPRSH